MDKKVNKAPNWTSETAPKGKGKGRMKVCFTYEDICRVTGLKLQTVRNHVHEGKLNVRDLVRLSEYIVKYRKRELK